MALVFYDRVRETTTVTGTNDATLLGAVTGFQAFSVVGNGNTCYYTIADQAGGNWECGIGTYSSTGPTLQRTTILSSSNSNNKVAFGAGTKDIFLTYPSSRAVYVDGTTITPGTAATLPTVSGGTGLSSFTANRVFYASSTSAIGQSANLTFNGTTLTANDFTDSSLTATRVTYAGTGGNLVDSANLTFNGTTLTSGGYSTGGNLTFTGTGNRITGDFSNATIANRVAFQTSTTNGNTVVGIIPNGTATISQFQAFGGSDIDNTSQVQFANVTNNAVIAANRTGTGTFGNILFNTSGSERLRIDTSGNVGIGTSSPAYRLDVNGAINNNQGVTFYRQTNTGAANNGIVLGTVDKATTSSGGQGLIEIRSNDASNQLQGQISLVTSATAGDRRLAITCVEQGVAFRNISLAESGGNVGIGTSSPAQRLDVNGTANFGNINTGNGVSTGTASIELGGLRTGDGVSLIDLHAVSGGDYATRIIRTGGTNGNFLIDNAGTGAFTLRTSGAGNMVFDTNNTERMRIDSSGNVLVGTTGNPSAARLFVAGGNLAVGTAAAPEFQVTSDGTNGYLDARLTGGGLIFRTNGSSERMRIASNGFVGIGTSSPAQLLNVSENSVTWCVSNAGGASYTGTTTNSALALITNSVERMRIDSSGNVGIGTSSPLALLSVGAGSLSDASVPIQINAASGSNAYIGLNKGGSYGGLIGFGNGGSGATVVGLQIRSVTTDPIQFIVNNTTEAMRITSGGEVYIAGTTDQGAYNLQCNGTGVWGAGAYVNGSDARIKEEVAPLDSGLDVVNKLNPVTYRYKEDWSKDQSIQPGFIAQDLLVALQDKNYVDGVVQQSGEYMSVAYQNLIPILAKAIQEQQAMIEELKSKVAQLESK